MNKKHILGLGITSFALALLLVGPSPADANEMSLDAEANISVESRGLHGQADASSTVGAKLDAEGMENYWTPERMRDAIPVRLEEMRTAYMEATPEEKEGLREEYKQERVEIREAFKARLEALRGEREDLREERVNGTSTLSVRAQANIENFANGLFQRLERALEQLNGIDEELAENIEDHEANGSDMTASSELLANAGLKLDGAETAQAEAKLQMEAMLGSDEPRELLDEVRTELNESKKALVEAKQALLDAVKQVRVDLSAEAEVGAEIESEE